MQLFNILFGPWANPSGSQITAFPDILGKMDFVTGSGHTIASIIPGVSTEGDTLLGDHNQVIGHIRDSASGGQILDFGNGSTIDSFSNVYGGDTYTMFDHVIGYTQPTADGLDIYSGHHDLIATASPDFLGNIDITSHITSSIPDVLDIHQTAFDSMDLFDSLQNLHDISDMHDTFDLIDAIGWF